MSQQLPPFITPVGIPATQDDGGAPANTLALMMELLCFCVARHNMRIKYFVLRNHCMEATLKLLARREAWLGVAAVRFMRTCIGLKVTAGAHRTPHNPLTRS